jgi:hypothetical protein
VLFLTRTSTATTTKYWVQRRISTNLVGPYILRSKHIYEIHFSFKKGRGKERKREPFRYKYSSTYRELRTNFSYEIMKTSQSDQYNCIADIEVLFQTWIQNCASKGDVYFWLHENQENKRRQQVNTGKTRVEARSNTSTVNLRVVRGDEMGLKKAAP